MSILNTARMGRFSSDRSIAEYCRDVWRVTPVPIEGRILNLEREGRRGRASRVSRLNLTRGDPLKIGIVGPAWSARRRPSRS